MAKLIVIDKNGNIKSKKPKGRGCVPSGFVKKGDDYYYETSEDYDDNSVEGEVDSEKTESPRPKKTKILVADSDQYMDFEEARNCLKDVGVIEKSDGFISLQSPVVYRHMILEPLVTFNTMYERVNLDLNKNEIQIWRIVYGGEPDIIIKNAFKQEY